MCSAKEFASVWDAIEDTSRQAACMRARADLMIALQEWVRIGTKTQAEAARVLGVTQPRMSDLMRGRTHLFSLDTLMDMATSAGMAPGITVTFSPA